MERRWGGFSEGKRTYCFLVSGKPLQRAVGHMDHIPILGFGLELACNGGSCGGISLERVECHLHFKHLNRISVSCTQVSFQYQEYKNGLLRNNSQEIFYT